jgi:hypothetical protein
VIAQEAKILSGCLNELCNKLGRLIISANCHCRIVQASKSLLVADCATSSRRKEKRLVTLLKSGVKMQSISGSFIGGIGLADGNHGSNLTS